MFWLRACRKCHGDLYRNTDVFGTYIACLQCGSYPTETEQAWLGLNASELSVQPMADAHLEQVAA